MRLRICETNIIKKEIQIKNLNSLKSECFFRGSWKVCFIYLFSKFDQKCYFAKIRIHYFT